MAAVACVSVLTDDAMILARTKLDIGSVELDSAQLL